MAQIKGNIKMKVVNRKTFLDLPVGTVYCKGTKWSFDNLSIKCGNVNDNDWVYLNPCWIEADSGDDAFNRLEEMLEKGISYPMEGGTSRDGCFDEDALFLIFERNDLKILFMLLQLGIPLEEQLK
jgi:hypothetical protein